MNAIIQYPVHLKIRSTFSRTIVMNMNNEHRKLEAENAFAMVLWKGVKIQLDKKSVRKSKKIVRNRVYAEALFNRMKIYAPRICLLRGIPIEK